MEQQISYLTAETGIGRQAIAEVMRRSLEDDIDHVPAQWARALVVDGVPVSYILVDPNLTMEYPGGDLRYAFILDVATREDRRGEGHFRRLMERTFADLRAAGLSLVLTHGRCALYRRFGFSVFTHHSGIFATPELIERYLGCAASAAANDLLVIEERRHIQPDLLLVTEVRAVTLGESRAALRAAAALARSAGKARILFEYPPAPSYGSRYPAYGSLVTPFTELACSIGAELRVQGADPEGGNVPDADWIKVLDAEGLMREALRCPRSSDERPPEGVVHLDTDAGGATIESRGGRVTVSAGATSGAFGVRWPSTALAQLLCGYRSAGALDALQGTGLPAEVMTMLDWLFPRVWRLSRNESWTYQS